MANSFIVFCNEIFNNFKELLPNYIKDKLTPKNLLYRVINTLIFSWILSLYVYIPFIVYMQYYGFFSYDLFGSDGLFAINVFILFTAFFLVSYSIMFTGSIGMYFGYRVCIDEEERRKYKIEKIPYLWLILGINIFIFIFTFIAVYSNINGEGFFNNLAWVLFLFIVSIPINIHIATIVFGSIKSQLISTLFSFCFVLPIMFFYVFSGSSSKLLEIILKPFGVGGKIQVLIEDKSKKTQEKGELIFLSPKNIYILDENKEKVIIERKDKQIRYINEVKKGIN